jgi:uroporphyrin-III C-methyltransferase
VDSAALEHVRRGDEAGARAVIEALVREAEGGDASSRAARGVAAPGEPIPRAARADRAPDTGSVALVGAGPGDAGLLTVRGLRLLRAADVVVYDRLVGAELLTHAAPAARLVCVGKRGHGASTPQAAIDALLVAEARAGRRVVRLKGGDPFVFGRGAEEAAALRAAGVPCEVVPGVTSAVAAPAAAGIPVTHRALAAGFAVVTGHECGDDPDATSLDWGALARMPTLVVLMGLRALPRIVERLRLHGVAGDVPAAVIAHGTLPTQRTVVATLDGIVDAVARAGVEQPATLVVGEVVRCADPARIELATLGTLEHAVA